MEYFIRHTDQIEITRYGFERLYNEHLIGIHYSSRYKVYKGELLNPEAYDQNDAKRGLNYLIELGTNGGYVWSDYSPINKNVIGKIEPNTVVELIDFDVDPAKNSVDCKDGKLIMKCLRFSETKDIAEDKCLDLKARRPQQGTFVKWHKSYGKIKNIFDGNFSIRSWTDLTPDQQEILVYEYLSHAESNKCHIHHLLMPIGRTMKDVDIYGVNKSRQKVFVQVTYLQQDKTKIDALSKYKGTGNLLVYAGDVEDKEEFGIVFMDVKKIFDWLNKNTDIISCMENA